MEIYQWLFKKNDFYISDIGYFLYVNGIKGDRHFDPNHKVCEHIGSIEFTTTLIPYIRNSNWVSDILLDIKSVLMSDSLPPPNEAHDLNSYYYERLRFETEISEI